MQAVPELAAELKRAAGLADNVIEAVSFCSHEVEIQVRYFLFFFMLLIVVVASGDLFAGRLANIADSISSSDYHKMKQLKNVALGAGLFFTVVGGLLIFNRKKLMVPVIGSYIMVLLGATLIAVKYI